LALIDDKKDMIGKQTYILSGLEPQEIDGFPLKKVSSERATEVE